MGLIIAQLRAVIVRKKMKLIYEDACAKLAEETARPVPRTTLQVF